MRGVVDVLPNGRPSGENYYSSTEGTKACSKNEIGACVESGHRGLGLREAKGFKRVEDAKKTERGFDRVF